MSEFGDAYYPSDLGESKKSVPEGRYQALIIDLEVSKDVQFYKVNLNKIGTSAIDCEIEEWKDCPNLSYITQKEMVESLDKSTER